MINILSFDGQQLLLIDFTALGDALQLRCTCRALDSVMFEKRKTYDVAIKFATTRPFVGGLPMSLRQWTDVWLACAFAVESQGIDASAWGHAIEFVSAEGVAYSWSQLEWLDPDVHHIDMHCDFLCDYQKRIFLLDPKHAAPIVDRRIAYACNTGLLSMSTTVDYPRTA